MASSLRGPVEERFGDWSVGRAVSVLALCALLGLTVECQPGRAQSSTSHPPVIATSTQWTLDAPKLVSTNASGISGDSFSLHPNFSPDGTHLLFGRGRVGTGRQQCQRYPRNGGAEACDTEHDFRGPLA